MYIEKNCILLRFIVILKIMFNMVEICSAKDAKIAKQQFISLK